MNAKTLIALPVLGFSLALSAAPATTDVCSVEIAAAKARRIAQVVAEENGDDISNEIPDALIGRGDDFYLVPVSYRQEAQLSTYAVSVGSFECEVRRIERRVRGN